MVPRKELATHMRESELQHLTAMTMLNLRLSRQLQQDSTERDKKITQLQQEITEITSELTELKGHIRKVEHMTHHVDHTTGGTCSACEVFTFTDYSKNKGSGTWVYCDPFYSYRHRYKFALGIKFASSDMTASVAQLKGEYDDQLRWPVKGKVRLELLNQARNRNHLVMSEYWKVDTSRTHVIILLTMS